MSQQVGIKLDTPIMSTIATGTIHALGTETTGTVLTERSPDQPEIATTP